MKNFDSLNLFSLPPAEATKILLTAPRDRGNPEHYFYGYWLTRIKEDTPLSREDWRLILGFPEWLEGPIGSLVKEACLRDRLSRADAEWLSALIPRESFAWRQIAALLLLDAEKSWGVKLEEAIALNAYWAAERVIAAAPEAELSGFSPMIERAGQKKRLRLAVAERLRGPLVVNQAG